MDTREQLLAQLENRYYIRKLPKLQRLAVYPLLTIKNSVLGRFVRHVLGPRLALHREVTTFFDKQMRISIPPFEDIWCYGAALGDEEFRLAKYILLNIAAGDIFFDVGANLGYYSLLVAQLIEPSGRVYAFEPSPAVAKMLQDNIKSEQRVQVVKKAVGRTEGRGSFYVGQGQYMANSTMSPETLREVGFSALEKFQSTTVETVSLDSFCLTHQTTPSFMKIDVEGAEEQVLLGAEKVLTDHSPTIAMEVWFNPFPENYRKAIALLDNYGFTPFVINEDGTVRPLRSACLEQDWLAWKGSKVPHDLDNLIFKKAPRIN